MSTTLSTSTERWRILAAGQVQGVGFRPFVYRLAIQHQLTGHVGNTSAGVCIEIQGAPTTLDSFVTALQQHLPPLARLTGCQISPIPLLPQEAAFRIIASRGHGSHSVLISPDMGICDHCVADMADTHNRRHLYPFTNCTNCGPRYTITRAIPYDRASTSMACFPLCPACQAEYDNPLDRRFHAQPNACPVCGPVVWAQEQEGRAQGLPALQLVAQRLREGRLAAVKGLGGFHLCCDALNATALALLRQRKQRPHKPLAVMVADVDSARLLAYVDEEEAALLCTPEKPIVLCKRRTHVLPAAIAPDTDTVGLVLPYTPLHHSLLHYYQHTPQAACPLHGPAALVMTSGNAGGEPICLGNREALTRLAHIADVFLLHNRDILVRCDDSVLAVPAPAPPSPSLTDAPAKTRGTALFYRRARGYVPRPVPLGSMAPSVLGMGPELKATLCLTRDNAAFVSQHVGDLQNVETLTFYREVAAHLECLLEVKPQALVCDLHPDFLSTQVAQDMAQERGLPCWRLQHHFAHAWSVLAENAYQGQAMVLVLDGTGLGDDDTIWGGELLYVDTTSLVQERLGRLSPFALPGGDAAIRQPWRVALALAAELGKEREGNLSQELAPELLSRLTAFTAAPAVLEMLHKRINCPLTSSAGRLFDAVAAGLGLCDTITYEGQAAICLEGAQKPLGWSGLAAVDQGYRAGLTKSAQLWELNSADLFVAALEEKGGTALAARRFHCGLAQGLVDMAAMAAQERGVHCVGLSGGVLQNATLAALLPHLLTQRGLRVLTHQCLPANDGGVSLGQAVWGRQRLNLGLA